MIEIFISLTPGFSRVIGVGDVKAVLTAFPSWKKPLKRFWCFRAIDTGLKPGVNENGVLLRNQ